MMRRTKIICTLGPATDDKAVLKDMMLAGMNVARMNFSHGSHEEHKGRMDLVKACRAELGLPIGIMLDTKGPEIRTKTYKNGKIEIQDGQTFTLTTRDIEGDESIVSITYEGLPDDVQPGTRILIDDGLIAFEVQEIQNGTDIVCKALNGGPLSNRKSINVPGIKLNMPFVSEKDRADIIFGLSQDIDFIAASFTRTRQDILDIKAILKEYGKEDVQIIAKIENMEGVDNVRDILEEATGVMVARGDLGVEVPYYELPEIQKDLIKTNVWLQRHRCWIPCRRTRAQPVRRYPTLPTRYLTVHLQSCFPAKPLSVSIRLRPFAPCPSLRPMQRQRFTMTAAESPAMSSRAWI